MKDCANITTIKPAFRKLRAFTFDPSLSLKLDTSVINNIVYKVPWETLKPGPVGEYIEVVDFDPSSGCFYKPVNLDDPYTLAQDGLDPAESNPQLHQQMVYAVAMITIKNFERALGVRYCGALTVIKVVIRQAMCSGCGSIPMLCGRPMRITVRRKKPCCLAISVQHPTRRV